MEPHPTPGRMTAGNSPGVTKARPSEGCSSGDDGKGAFDGNNSTTNPLVAGGRGLAISIMTVEKRGADGGFHPINAATNPVTLGEGFKSPLFGHVTSLSIEEESRCEGRLKFASSNAPSMGMEAFLGTINANQPAVGKGISDTSFNGLSCNPQSPPSREVLMHGCEDGLTSHEGGLFQLNSVLSLSDSSA